jgi:uncharacterized surface protein with fasciclin (FAS1) repeats
MRKLIVAVLAFALLVLGSGASQANAAGSTITDIAVKDGRFKTLVAALTATGLDKVVAGTGPFTVFAPTDAAFAKLPKGTVEALLKDLPTLTSILTYHVVAGAVPAATVVKLQGANTVNGAPVNISIVGGKVILNGAATVIITDIKASNGIIHVIDTVLIPPADVSSQLKLITADQTLFSAPGGISTGVSVKQCDTYFITRTWQNFGFIPAYNAWVNLASTQQVNPDYGQPGGQAKPGYCAGR